MKKSLEIFSDVFFNSICPSWIEQKFPVNISWTEITEHDVQIFEFSDFALIKRKKNVKYKSCVRENKDKNK